MCEADWFGLFSFGLMSLIFSRDGFCQKNLKKFNISHYFVDLVPANQTKAAMRNHSKCPKNSCETRKVTKKNVSPSKT